MIYIFYITSLITLTCSMLDASQAIIGSEKFVWYKFAQPPALRNCTNTCFLNASLQLFLLIDPLVDMSKTIVEKDKERDLSSLRSEMEIQVNNPFKDNQKITLPAPVFYCMRVIDEYARGATMKFDCLGLLKYFVHSAYNDFFGNSVILTQKRKDEQLAILYAEKESINDLLKKGAVGFAKEELLKDLERNKNDTEEFMKAETSEFPRNAQQDAILFMTSFLGKIPSELGLQKHYQTELHSYINCPTQENLAAYHSKTKENEIIISLPITDQTKTLENCLDEYFKTERLSDSVKDADGNSRKDCTKTLSIKTPRPFLFFSLARSVYNKNTLSLEKKNNTIVIPYQLDITPFLDQSAVLSESSMYKLIGAVVQSGSADAGHYWAYVNKNDIWYKCNDSVITPVSKQFGEINNEDKGYIDGGSSTTGYCFLYKRQEKVSPAELQRIKDAYYRSQGIHPKVDYLSKIDFQKIIKADQARDQQPDQKEVPEPAKTWWRERLNAFWGFFRKIFPTGWKKKDA